MTSRILISLSLLLLAGQKVGAQFAPAEDFFNSGAQLFISNNIPAALERVQDGLKTYPDDGKLKQLEQLLKQQPQQQQPQQQKNQQQKNQQQQNQQDQQSSQQKPQDQQKQQEEKQKQAEQKKEEQQKQPDQQPSAAQPKEGEKKDQPDTEGQPVKAGQLTPEEAKRLLDSQKDNEQLLQMKPQEKPRNPMHTIKDW